MCVVVEASFSLKVHREPLFHQRSLIEEQVLKSLHTQVLKVIVQHEEEIVAEEQREQEATPLCKKPLLINQS